MKNCNLLIPTPPLRTPKLQEKPSALKREHLALWKFCPFFYFLGSFLPSWIRIRISNLYADPDPDPDPAAQINADPCPDPDPDLKPCSMFFIANFKFCLEKVTELPDLTVLWDLYFPQLMGPAARPIYFKVSDGSDPDPHKNCSVLYLVRLLWPR